MWLLQSIITMPIGAAKLSLQRYEMFFRKALIFSCFCVCCVIFALVGKLSSVMFRALRTQRITPALCRGYFLYKINSLAQGFCDGGQGVKPYTIPPLLYAGDVVASDAAHLAQLLLCQSLFFSNGSNPLPYSDTLFHGHLCIISASRMSCKHVEL